MISPTDSMRAVLGAMILDVDAIALCLMNLRPDAMQGYPEGKVLKALRSQGQQGTDLALMARELIKTGDLAPIGGPVFLAQLLEYAAPMSTLLHHCEIVNQEAISRAVKQVCHATLTALDDPSQTADNVLDRTENAVLGVRDGAMASTTETIGVVISRLSEAGWTGLKTGFRFVDWATGGLYPGQLVVLGARPGMGKTAFAVSLAQNVARAGHRVLFFSLEMVESEIAERFIALEGTDLKTVKRRQAPDHSSLEASKLPVWIDHSPRATLNDIHAKIRRHPSDLVIVDYLQLVHETGDRVEAVERITRGLKSIAKQAKLPIFAMAQLNRSVEGQHGKLRRPVLSDLRESGGIENHADTVMFLHRDYYEPDNPKAELIIAKNRQGPTTGPTALHFAKASLAFTDDPNAQTH